MFWNHMRQATNNFRKLVNTLIFIFGFLDLACKFPNVAPLRPSTISIYWIPGHFHLQIAFEMQESLKTSKCSPEYDRSKKCYLGFCKQCICRKIWWVILISLQELEFTISICCNYEYVISNRSSSGEFCRSQHTENKETFNLSIMVGRVSFDWK